MNYTYDGLNRLSLHCDADNNELRWEYDDGPTHKATVIKKDVGFDELIIQ